MSKPEFKESPAGYEYTWPEQSLRIGVSRIKQHKDGRVTGWLMITALEDGHPVLLHQCDFNFNSTQTMATLVRTMREKTTKTTYESSDWNEIIEQLRYYTLERVRQGEPVLELTTDDTDITPPTYLIDPILPESQPTVIFGEPGVGKSELSLLMYVCLILPWYDNPLSLEVPDRSIKTLLLDYETDDKRVKWRLKCLQLGMDLPPIGLHYRRCFIPLAEDLEHIQLALSETHAEVLIIDSLGAAAGGDLKEPSIANNFFNTLRRLNTTPLVIAQTSKEDKKTKTIFGSYMFEYYSRSIWELKKSQEVGADELDIALYHRKANESKLHRPLGFHLYYNENQTTVRAQNLRDVERFRTDMPIKIRIVEELKHGPLTKEELAEELELTASSTSKNLTQLKNKGEVLQLPDHKWGLATKEPDLRGG